MPYIKRDRRKKVLAAARRTAREILNLEGFSSGDVNYAITAMLVELLVREGGPSYTTMNTLVGALECAKLELYRRVCAPYEDGKRMANGEVYPDVADVSLGHKGEMVWLNIPEGHRVKEGRSGKKGA